MKRTMLIAAAAGLAFALGGCGQSAEKTGENLDNAVDDATQGRRNMGDGAMERAGEAVDQTTGQQRQGDAADAINDATDGDQHTKP